MMERLTRTGLRCAVMAMGWLLGACAPAPAEPAIDPSPAGLGATLETPSPLPSGETVQATFALTNHSPGRLYVLTWYTPLEGIFGELFRVEHDGQALPYEGPLVMRGDPLPENYVLLDPGASVSAEVDLATAYDFSQAGEYTIEFVSPRISHVAKTEDGFATSVNDLGPVETNAHLLRYDSVHGRFPAEVKTTDTTIDVGDTTYDGQSVCIDGATVTIVDSSIVSEVYRAIDALHGQQVNGRDLTVRFAQPRKYGA